MPDLCTLQNVKEWLNQTTTTDDAMLARMIASQSQNALNYMNRSAILSAAYTEKYSGVGMPSIMLRQWPVTAVAAVSINGIAIAAQTAPPWGVGYFFAPYTGPGVGGPCLLGVSGSVFARGLNNIQVTYTAGYAAVPDAIENAVIEMVALRYRERSRIGITSQSDGQTTTSFVKDSMTPSIAEALDKYKMVVPL